MNFNRKTNLIYSDADHTEKGLMFEYEYFYKLVLDEEFILYFDDINSKTMPGFLKILEKLEQKDHPVVLMVIHSGLMAGWERIKISIKME